MNSERCFQKRKIVLSRKNPEWKQIFKSIGNMVLVLDPDRRIMAANRTVLELLNRNEGQLLGKYCREVFECNINSMESCPVQRILQSNGMETIRMESEMLGKAFQISCTPIFKNGKLSAVIHTATDISERKEAEERSLLLNRKLLAISACNKAMVRAVDEQALLDDVCRIICDVGGYRMAWVGMAEADENKSVRPIAWAGFEDGYLAEAGISWADTERGRGPTGTAIREGKTSYFHDFAGDPHAVPWRISALERNYRCSIALPLPDSAGKTLGALTIYSAKPNAFIPDEVLLLEELAGNLAYGITALRTSEERRRADEARSLLVSLVESTDDAVIATDLEGMTLSWNNGAERIYGYTPAEIIGKPIELLLPENRRDEKQIILKTIQRGKSISHFETERVAKDGTVVPVSMSVSPVIDPKGKIICKAVIARDISKRKEAEAQLILLNRKLLALGACNRAMVRSVDEQTLLDDVCRIICEVGGYRMAWVGMVEPDENKTVRPVAWAGVEDGYLAEVEISWADTEKGRGPTGTAIRTGETSYFRDLLSDPRVLPWTESVLDRNYRSSIALALPDSKGKTFGALTIYSVKPNAFIPSEVLLLEELAGNLAYGITALRTREERNRADEARSLLVSLIESTNDAVIATDLDWRTIVWNNGAERLYGYSPAEIIGKSIAPLLPESRRDEMQDIMETIKSGKSISHFETERVAKNGTVVPVSLTASPVFDSNGKVICASVIARDISKRKKAEEERRNLEQHLVQAQKMEAIGVLAGGIAHDFNNILSPIIGFAELGLQDVPPDSPLHRDLKSIHGAGLRAKDLVAQILAFARKTEHQKAPVPLGSIIKEVLKFLRASVPVTIDIRYNISSEAVHGMVLGDPTQIHQIVMNLCTNAAHAMRESGGVLAVSLVCSHISAEPASECDAVTGPCLRLSVSDTGHGMTKEVREKIFEPFFTTKVQGEGTGIGLSVVYGIVQNLGGAISVESEPGEGTLFHVDLPMFDNSINVKSETPNVVPAKGKGEALLVDDEVFLTQVGKRILGRLGFEVLAVNRSPEALKIFREDPYRFSLVVTDQTMPDMTGLEMVRAMLALRPELPVIMCTGFSETVSEETAKKAGVREFLLKPLDMQALSDAVRRIQASDPENAG